MGPHFDFSRLATYDFRQHYEKVAIQSLQSVLRHRMLIGTIILAALVLAALLVTVLPRRYTAEALVQPQLFSRAEQGGATTTVLASIDGASLVASEASLIQSPAVAKAVVLRLGLDKSPEFGPPSSLIGRALRALRSAVLPETVLKSPSERATRSVSSKLAVERDTRSYIISIGFTAQTPEEAARIANAFALEYANTKALQRFSEQVAAANREVARTAAIYGEKHPSYMRALADLALAKQRLEAAVNRPVGSDLAPSEGITFAEPSSAPSSPNGVAILGLAFFLALITGVCSALWIDFRRQTGSARSGGRP